MPPLRSLKPLMAASPRRTSFKRSRMPSASTAPIPSPGQVGVAVTTVRQKMIQTRHLSVYGFGSQWTGALSRGSENLFFEEAPELSVEEQQQGIDGGVQTMVRLKGLEDEEDSMSGGSASQRRVCVVGASAGWGHTALLIQNNCHGATAAAASPEGSSKGSSEGTATTTTTQLMISGRPHDFQTFMRLRRLPAFLRNFSIINTLPKTSLENSYNNNNSITQQEGQRQQHQTLFADEQQTNYAQQSPAATTPPPPPRNKSILQNIATYFAGEDITFHEEEHRRYSMIPTLIQMKLPNGDTPAVEGQLIGRETLFDVHGRGRVRGSSTSSSSFHTHYQNTLATSAGLTAVISQNGTLYTFGLNHRGQCGIGKFSPNVWTPTKVVGLASTRFMLDHGLQYDDDEGNRSNNSNNNNSKVLNYCQEQEYPIVSVSLGLQHGIALDSAGQVFCWGKGERGQLGLGRRLAREGNSNNNNNNIRNGEQNTDEEDEQPNQNRTLEHAWHVSNFYDPYATIDITSPSYSGMHYAPLLSPTDSKIRLISAGMNFSLAVTNSNLPYIWGKNCVPNPGFQRESPPSSHLDFRSTKQLVQDSTYPRYIPGLPPNLDIVKVACGSHHAAMLLEDGSVWAVGVATDQPVPMWEEAVEILPRGMVEMPVVSFNAGFDRTVVVSNTIAGDGVSGSRRQVIEIQLWSHEELRMHGAVRPTWVDYLESQEEGGKTKHVRSVHRGWMHTIVVTDEDL